MFDLDDALADWRQSLAASDCCREEDLDELESHLREEREALSNVGLSGEEAFLIGTRRLGSTDALAREFAKASPAHAWSHRLCWIASGILGYLLCAPLVDSLTQLFCYRWGYAYLGDRPILAFLTAGFRIGVGVALIGLLYLVTCRGSWGVFAQIERVLHTRGGRLLFVITATLAGGAVPVVRILVGRAAARAANQQWVGHYSLAVCYTDLLLSVALPLLLAVIIAITWRKSPRQHDPQST